MEQDVKGVVEDKGAQESMKKSEELKEEGNRYRYWYWHRY
jgi:hypothetical protein